MIKTSDLDGTRTKRFLHALALVHGADVNTVYRGLDLTAQGQTEVVGALVRDHFALFHAFL